MRPVLCEPVRKCVWVEQRSPDACWTLRPRPHFSRSKPQVVSHVCPRWRNVAFSTPSLWTAIQVGPIARGSHWLQSTVLKWSKSLLMDLSVDYGDYDSEPNHHLTPTSEMCHVFSGQQDRARSSTTPRRVCLQMLETCSASSQGS
ncbi:hypothetical protein V8E55_006524 [Tylopilus felleus]